MANCSLHLAFALKTGRFQALFGGKVPASCSRSGSCRSGGASADHAALQVIFAIRKVNFVRRPQASRCDSPDAEHGRHLQSEITSNGDHILEWFVHRCAHMASPSRFWSFCNGPKSCTGRGWPALLAVVFPRPICEGSGCCVRKMLVVSTCFNYGLPSGSRT